MSKNTQETTVNTTNQPKLQNEPAQLNFTNKLKLFFNRTIEKSLELKNILEDKISQIKLDFEDMLLIEIAQNFQALLLNVVYQFAVGGMLNLLINGLFYIPVYIVNVVLCLYLYKVIKIDNNFKSIERKISSSLDQYMKFKLFYMKSNVVLYSQILVISIILPNPLNACEEPSFITSLFFSDCESDFLFVKLIMLVFSLSSMVWITIISQNIENKFIGNNDDTNIDQQNDQNAYSKNCETEKNDRSSHDSSNVLMYNPYQKHQQTHQKKTSKKSNGTNDANSSFSDFGVFIKKKVTNMIYDNNKNGIEQIRERHENTFCKDPEQQEENSTRNEAVSSNVLEGLST